MDDIVHVPTRDIDVIEQILGVLLRLTPRIKLEDKMFPFYSESSNSGRGKMVGCGTGEMSGREKRGPGLVVL